MLSGLRMCLGLGCMEIYGLVGDVCVWWMSLGVGIV